MLRRGLLQLMLGGAAMTFPRNQVGFQNPPIVTANEVILFGNKRLILAYEPTPGANNLVASLSPVTIATTDKYGNTVLSGYTSYEFDALHNRYVAGSLGPLGVTFSATAGPSQAGAYSPIGQLGMESGGTFDGDMLFNAATGKDYFFNGGAGAGRLLSIAPIVPVIAGAIETWHDATGLLNANFAAGGTNPRFQIINVGTARRVVMDGAINVTGAVAAGTTAFTLPGGYNPARALDFQSVTNSGGVVAGNAVVTITAAGNVNLAIATAAGKFFKLDNIEYALD